MRHATLDDESPADFLPRMNKCPGCGLRSIGHPECPECGHALRCRSCTDEPVTERGAEECQLCYVAQTDEPAMEQRALTTEGRDQ